ncbi:hypothetical protein BGI41_06195 [Methanobrevibacter sp. 87.7]|uniref:Ig-like domain-containing protein n=1 Tax=Methanobrevibacter sp. 87.7 TaxID=387957 RepID=UPI000B4FDC9D|nr:Ig-like domain-containing protein [Methanobrevibacter sp. 87.7]OWT32723.1 hypothetical protein BGI41_06195 [Methanobrevibacter sp. 87.7]
MLLIIVCVFLTFSTVSAADNSSSLSSSVNIANSTNYGVNVNHQDITSDSGSNVDIYVSPSGDDSNTGLSDTSALKTINASLSKVNESNKAVVHLGEGTFSGDGNNMIDISLPHKNYQGSLTFIGAGYNKTFIDGENQYKLFTVSADSNVIFINVTFINAKDNLGGVMTNNGNVSFEDCIFENNTATSYGGSLYTTGLSTTVVKDSLFVNNNANYNGGSAYMDGNASFINSKFINSTVSAGNYNKGGAIYFDSDYNFDLIGCEFYNVTAGSGGVGYIRGSSKDDKDSVFTIKNNKFVNCTASASNTADVLYIINGKIVKLANNIIALPGKNAPFYAYPGTYVENLNVVFMNNATEDVNSPTFYLTASVTDDMGNKISGGNVYFNINNNEVGYSSLNNGVASIRITDLLDNGVYTISGYYECADENSVNIKTGAINFNIDRTPIELYVSPSGNDETGDGSLDNPFNSVKKAINTGFENNINVIIHLAEGTYTGENNTDLTVKNIGYVKIIGAGYNKSIIDANGANSQFISFGSLVSADIINMTFSNSITNNGFVSHTSIDSSKINLIDCIFENIKKGLNAANANVLNCTFNNSSAFVKLSSINNSKFIGFKDSFALELYTSNVYNTLFENNTAGAITACQGVPLHEGISYIIDSCTFINNSAVNGSAISYPTGFQFSGDRIGVINNCTFINNTATDYAGALFVDPTMTMNITNNKFYDNTAEYGAAVVVGNVDKSIEGNSNITFINNTMTNNKANVEGSDIYIFSPNTFSPNVNVNVKFNDLTTTKLSDVLSVDVTDDMGNKISGGEISYYLGDDYVGKAALINGSSKLNYVGFATGSYVLSGNYSYSPNRSNIKNGNVKVDIKDKLDNITLHVATYFGNDVTGDGLTTETAFKTIRHAYEVGISKSTNIIIYVYNGRYLEFNESFVVSGNVNLTIMGVGITSTFLMGNPNADVAKPLFIITPGKQNFVLSNLTVQDGVVKYNKSNPDNYAENIIIPKGVTAYFDAVEFRQNHGYMGGVVTNEGNLTIHNCTFFNNGDSYYASTIYNNGTLNITNSTFRLNHAAMSTIYNNGTMFINSSKFEDDLRSGYMSFFFRIRNDNYAEINNTVFAVTSLNQTQILSIIGTDNVQYGTTNVNDKDNPLCSNTLYNAGTIIYSNDTFIDHPGRVKYNGPKNSDFKWGTDGRFIQAYGNTTFIDSRFINIKELDVVNPNNVVIKGCLFENISNIKVTLTRQTGSYVDYANNITINNNVILFNETSTKPFTVSFTSNNYTLNFDNNWFGNNSRPYYMNSSTKVNLNKWLVLVIENGTAGNFNQSIIFGFKVFDGENLTEFDGNLPIRNFKFETEDGVINPVSGTFNGSKTVDFTSTTIGPKSLNLTVDKQVLSYDISIYKALLLNISSLVVLGNTTAIVTLTDAEGNPVTNDITILVDGVEYQVTVKDGKTEFTPEEFSKTGKYFVVLNYAGNDEYLSSTLETDVYVLKYSVIRFDIDDDGIVIINVTDAIDNPISDIDVKYTINGTDPITLTTNKDGIAKINNLTDIFTINAEFDGNDAFLGSNLTNTLYIIPKAPVRLDTNIVSSDFTQTAVDFYNGERGRYFSVVLKDSEGNVLAGKPVSIGFNGVVYNLVTDASGVAKLQINLAWSGIYTFAIAFLGDDDYKGSFVVNKITINSKATTITVGGLSTLKVNTYRTLTFVLKGVNALDSKKYVNAVGKKLVVTVNGKTYNLKTDKNGKATLKVKFSNAGTYTITTRFAGDGTFAAKTVTSKITVKK